ncbi:unnamed protein product, partial [Rotaria sp. Silwood1]
GFVNILREFDDQYIFVDKNVGRTVVDVDGVGIKLDTNLS